MQMQRPSVRLISFQIKIVRSFLSLILTACFVTGCLFDAHSDSTSLEGRWEGQRCGAGGLPSEVTIPDLQVRNDTLLAGEAQLLIRDLEREGGDVDTIYRDRTLSLKGKYRHPRIRVSLHHEYGRLPFEGEVSSDRKEITVFGDISGVLDLSKNGQRPVGTERPSPPLPDALASNIWETRISQEPAQYSMYYLWFNKNGQFDLTLSSTYQIGETPNGRYELHADTLFIRGAGCEETKGTYRVSVGLCRGLDLRQVEDECESRSEILSQNWNREGPPSVW